MFPHLSMSLIVVSSIIKAKLRGERSHLETRMPSALNDCVTLVDAILAGKMLITEQCKILEIPEGYNLDTCVALHSACIRFVLKRRDITLKTIEDLNRYILDRKAAFKSLRDDLAIEPSEMEETLKFVNAMFKACNENMAKDLRRYAAAS